MSTAVDVGTLDLIENALLNARFEMDEVVRRAAMSPTIRVQHDEFPMICNGRGQMVVGQFGSYIPEVIDRFSGGLGATLARGLSVDLAYDLGRNSRQLALSLFYGF